MQAAVRLQQSKSPSRNRRLRLRGHRQDDFAACCALWSDPVVTSYTSGKALAPEEVWAKMLRYAGLWRCWVMATGRRKRRPRANSWASLASATSSAISNRHSTDMPECGWALLPRVHGKGYATEGCVGRDRLGRRAPRASERPAASLTRKICVDPRGGEMRVSGMAAQRTYKEHDVLLFTR